MRNRICFHLWCELTLALWCHSIICSLFSSVSDDPEERKNLAASDPDRVAAMIAKLDVAKLTERLPDLEQQIPSAAGEASNFGGNWTPGWC